jgi:hypothetical protein
VSKGRSRGGGTDEAATEVLCSILA